jgi:hypothetical protein
MSADRGAFVARYARLNLGLTRCLNQIRLIWSGLYFVRVGRFFQGISVRIRGWAPGFERQGLSAKPRCMGRRMVRIARDQASTSFLLSVLLILGANMLFPLQDALTKQMITTLPVWAVLFVRSAAVLAVTLAIGRARLVHHVLVTPWTRDWGRGGRYPTRPAHQARRRTRGDAHTRKTRMPYPSHRFG